MTTKTTKKAATKKAATVKKAATKKVVKSTLNAGNVKPSAKLISDDRLKKIDVHGVTFFDAKYTDDDTAQETAYSHLKRNHSTKVIPQRIVTIAALIVAGAVTMSGAGILSRSNKKFHPKLFKKLVGNRPYSFHSSKDRINADGLTSDGIVWFNNALHAMGAGGWDADKGNVRKVRDCMTGKNDNCTLEGIEDCPSIPLSFKYPVTVNVFAN